MLEVRQTELFASWLANLTDTVGAARIVARIDRIAFTGNLGDVKRFDGLLEVRCDFGPGYRLYAIERSKVLVILLCGGDKRSQKRDIAMAKRLMADVI